MNISEAKEYIENSVRVYLKKDEFGEYRIPVVRQRPIFLLGAPGIGKTAIMEQIASDMGIALVSYSMTHHTRQSALGLPFIKERCFDNRKYDVSEYTMSEIIASVYETMEESGVKEGILFLDEINCVSETLAPSMLQFLQYKVFGKHKVPEGWVIVTAGNPPEYNQSVREFDVVTLDRLKVLEVEADYQTWKLYASERGVHSSITGFLESKPEYFYSLETTAEGKCYVTARGWEDLSQIICLYEEEGLVVDETLIGQYLSNRQIVKEYFVYYQLYNKYKSDYRVEELLEGSISNHMLERAAKAAFDERLSLLGMLIARIQTEMKEQMEAVAYLGMLQSMLKSLLEKEDKEAAIKDQIMRTERAFEQAKHTGALSDADKRKFLRILRFLRGLVAKEYYDAESIKSVYAGEVKNLQASVEFVQRHVDNAFVFTEKAFGDVEGNSNEMLVFVTELTLNQHSSAFLARFGSANYEKYSKLLMVSGRKDELREDIRKVLGESE